MGVPRPLRRFEAGRGRCGKLTDVLTARGFPMPDKKSATSKRVKAIYWVLVPVLVALWGLVALALIFGSEDEPEYLTVQVNITPTAELAPTPEPTLAPTKVPTDAAIPTATPTTVVLRMSADEYEEWKKQQSTKATATAKAIATTISASRRAANARNNQQVAATRRVRESKSTSTRIVRSAPSISHSVNSNRNVVGRKQISLPSGRYTLSETSGCLGSELAKLSNDDLVLSTTSGPRSGHVTGGRYILRAIGNNCTTTIRN